MIVHIHEPNSVGRAKLRRLTTRRRLTIQGLATAITAETGTRIGRPTVSNAINGIRASNRFVAALEVWTEGAICEADWKRRYRGAVDRIPVYEQRGRPRNGSVSDALFDFATSKGPPTKHGKRPRHSDPPTPQRRRPRPPAHPRD